MRTAPVGLARGNSGPKDCMAGRMRVRRMPYMICPPLLPPDARRLGRLAFREQSGRMSELPSAALPTPISLHGDLCRAGAATCGTSLDVVHGGHVGTARSDDKQWPDARLTNASA